MAKIPGKLACIIQRFREMNDLQRGAAIVLLRDAGESHRRLAKVAGCRAGLIRHIEIVGRLPQNWKQLLRNGHPTRKVVKAWWAQQRQSRKARG